MHAPKQNPRRPPSPIPSPLGGEGEPNRKFSLTARSVKGVMLLGLQTVLVKAGGLAGQIVLSWLLLPEDFGLLGLSYTVAALTGVIRQIGLREFLIHRKGAGIWVGPALWMAFTMGLLSSLLILLAAPAAAWFYDAPRIEGLLYVLALAQPFISVGSVLSGMLQQRMQFKALSVLGTTSALSRIGLSVGLAWIGLGAYSFVVPVPLVEALFLLPYGWLVRPQPGWRPRLRRWRFFFRTSSFVFLTGLLGTLLAQGDYALLGYYHSADVVGLYYFAFNLARQATTLLWEGLAGVLFPAFATLGGDRQRLAEAFRKTVRTIALLFVPLSLLQVPLAGPLIHLVFSEKWLPAIPLVQMMSFSMALHSVAEPCFSLLQAQGRFALNFSLTVIWTAGFLAVVAVAARHGGAFEVALAVAVYYAVCSPIYFWVVTRSLGFGFRALLQFYFSPLFLSGLAIGAGWYTVEALALSELGVLLVLPGIAALVYLLLLWFVAGEQLRNTVKPLIRVFG